MEEKVVALGLTQLIPRARADVARVREGRRRSRALKSLAVLLPLALYLIARDLSGNPVTLPTPHLPPDWQWWLPGVLLIALLAVVLLLPMGSGRSPHVLILPEQIEVGFEDVKGAGPVLGEVVRTLNAFLGFMTFREKLGGRPRRGILFEGKPGTGKTYMAKAMAREAGVPFLFVSGPAFQSMWYGMTARRIRSYFRALKKAARKYGGAIGFIEEIDAIGAARGALEAASPLPPEARGFARHLAGVLAPGTGGVVNELLIQLQSFDEPTFWERILARLAQPLPASLRSRLVSPKYHNVLVIGATNRSDVLDPALLRPGRFDKRLYFDLPSRQARREIIDYYLARKAHQEDLDREEKREELASITIGYTPAMIESLLDEALLVALREGRSAMSWDDILTAKLETELGLPQPTTYTEREKEVIATHEAGHAVVAWLSSPSPRFELLSIVKRREALGLLAHSDTEERFTRSRSELRAMLRVSLAGMAAEEKAFGEAGTGAGSDLAQATRLAAQMVGVWGIEGSLISFQATDGGLLGGDAVARVLQDSSARERVERILEEEKGEARRILEENWHLVEALRKALLEGEELTGEEVQAVLAGAAGLA